MKPTRTIKVLMACFAVCLLALVARSAFAGVWAKSTTGYVGDMYVGGVGEAYFSLQGLPHLCDSSGDTTIGLLYVKTRTDGAVDFAGGQALVALLTAAKQSGKMVTVYANNNGGPGSPPPPPGGSYWGCLVGGIVMH